MTTYRTIERYPAFRGALECLIEAARVVGGQQVRNIATVGGNIANASPAADFVPALLCLDPTLEIVGPQGTRRVPLNELIRGPGATDMRASEILAAIEFAPLPERSATAFLKEGRRKAMEISVVCVAASLTLDPHGTCTAARIAIGAAAPVGDMGQQRQIGREAGGISRPGHRLDELSRKRDDIKLGLDFRNWG